MIINVGTDSGKSFTKAAIKLPTEEFVTTVFPTSYEATETKAAPDGCFEVVFEQQRYIVGEANRKCSVEKDGRSKEQFIHKICTLTAVCNVIQKAKLSGAKIADVNVVNITVNMPLSEYLNKAARKSAIEYYNSGKVMTIVVDGVTYSFTLNVLPYYEGVGAILMNAEDYKTKRVISLDLGSLNTGYVTLDKLKIVSTNDCDAGTIDYGCARLLTSVRKLLKDQGVKSIKTDTQILEVIRGENDMIKPEITELAKAKVKDYVREIYDELSDLEVGVDSTLVVASGGAAYLYNEHFNDIFENNNVAFQAEGSEFLNAKGSLKLLA